ncbi:MAG: hypothetical protein IT162_04215 [Bryobacterales bacterium]|nr:hypothetical protein [Bryobacterales bacterium]
MTHATATDTTARAPRSFAAWISAAVRTVLYPVARFHRRQVWSVPLCAAREASDWSAAETPVLIGPHNYAAEMTPELAQFTGPDEAALAGVRRGDRLCAVRDADTGAWLAYTYVFFAANTPETRRQVRILGTGERTPVVGLSFTAPAARGRGLYRRLLNEIFAELHRLGHRECVCEIDPANAASQAASRAAGMAPRLHLSEVIVLGHLLLQRVRPEGGGAARWRWSWV